MKFTIPGVKMTVSSEISRSGPYNGNGVTTIFDYEFKIDNENDLQIVKAIGGVETTLLINADYIVSDVGSAGGGQVVMTAPPAIGATITILREVPFTQETDLENQGAYFAETVERALDLALMRDQQLREQLDRSVKIPVSADGTELASLIDDIVRLGASADNIDAVANISAEVVVVAGLASVIPTVAADVAAAELAAIRSQSWAEQPYGEQVIGNPDGRSALHYSEVSHQWATEAQAWAETVGGLIYDFGLLSEDLSGTEEDWGTL